MKAYIQIILENRHQIQVTYNICVTNNDVIHFYANFSYALSKQPFLTLLTLTSLPRSFYTYDTIDAKILGALGFCSI